MAYLSAWKTLQQPNFLDVSLQDRLCYWLAECPLAKLSQELICQSCLEELTIHYDPLSSYHVEHWSKVLVRVPALIASTALLEPEEMKDAHGTTDDLRLSALDDNWGSELESTLPRPRTCSVGRDSSICSTRVNDQSGASPGEEIHILFPNLNTAFQLPLQDVNLGVGKGVQWRRQSVWVNNTEPSPIVFSCHWRRRWKQ